MKSQQVKESPVLELKQKPFLKWAGGKTQMLSELVKYAPTKYNRYFESFLGGGALYFALNPKEPVISDLNRELIITYKAVQTNVESVIEVLRSYQNKESFYYAIRATECETLSDEERAARLIYLNKTCFNGLYRVNKKGGFNVPYGKRTGEFINEAVLRRASEYLQNATIIYGSYQDVLRLGAKKNDFVFLDPPYYPVGKNSDFQRYTKEFFYEHDQIALKLEFDRLVNLGCHVLLTNSDHPFILDLYKDYDIKIFETKRMISSNASTRTGRDILVIGR